MKFSESEMQRISSLLNSEVKMAQYLDCPVTESVLYSIHAEMGSWLEMRKMATEAGNHERAKALDDAYTSLDQILKGALQEFILGAPPVFHDSN